MKKNFSTLTRTFKSSIKTWDYLVNWNKVETNILEIEIVLNKLNYLIGKSDLKAEFLRLHKSNPDITKAFPILLAIRGVKVEIYEPNQRTTQIFDFSKEDAHTSEEYFSFLTDSRLVNLFNETGIKNLVDYVMGVEVGLDSNGRKNRGGTLMESIVEMHVKDFAEKNGLLFLKQVNANKILKEWGYKVRVDKSSRSFDFAVFNKNSNKLKLFETNFYNGGGSKLKAVCGEFKGLHNELKSQNIDFIWVTDGEGWQTTLRPLEEVFNNNDYIFNLQMLEDGILSELKW